MKTRTLGRRRRRGFSVMEMALTSVLMVVVGLILSQAWVTFGRPAIASMARARLAQEANLAAESFAHDVGLLASPAGNPADSRYQNVQGDGSTLFLTIDRGDGVLATVTYATDDNDPGKLFRTDAAGKQVVATLVTGFHCQATTAAVGPAGSAVPGVQIDLTLEHRTYDRDRDGSYRSDHTRRYSLFVPDP